jgi:glycosyltransferase involved in cell wall biosynthesis
LANDYGVVPDREVRRIPLLRVNPVIDRAAARAALGLAPDDILICSFGIVAPEKLSQLVLAAFVEAGLAAVVSVQLVFVGSAPGEYGEALARQMRTAGRSARISCTGFVDDFTYHAHLAAADLAIQLRSGSRGETSAAALDVLNYGVLLIVNAHGTMAELDRAAVVMLDDEVKVPDLAAAIKRLIKEPAERTMLGNAGKALDQHCAQHRKQRGRAEEGRARIEHEKAGEN